MLLEKEDLIALNRTGENLKSVLRHIVAKFPHSNHYGHVTLVGI